MRSKYSVILSIFILICSFSSALLRADEPKRLWHTRFGGELEAVWNRKGDNAKSELIHLRSSSGAFRVRFSDLVPEDQEYILNRRSEKETAEPDSETAKPESEYAPVPDSDEQIPSAEQPQETADSVPQADPIPVNPLPDGSLPPVPEVIKPTSPSEAVSSEKDGTQSIPAGELNNGTAETAAQEAVVSEIPKSGMDQPGLYPGSVGSVPGEQRSYTIAGIVYSFRWCPPGEYNMGSIELEPGRSDDEHQHRVTITRGFWILETEITQMMWESIIDRNPSWFCETGSGSLRVEGIDTGTFPVEQVTWNEAVKFCSFLSNLSGLRITLPTEAEWEYACRAGTTETFSFGNQIAPDEANFDGSISADPSQRRKFVRNPFPVASFPPNPWGLYDMHGNVAEWCQDYYDDLPTEPVTDPQGPTVGKSKVCRGGSWFYNAEECRSASRYGVEPDMRSYCQGFRIVIRP